MSNYAQIKAELASFLATKGVAYESMWVTFPGAFVSVDFWFGRLQPDGAYRFAQSTSELYTQEEYLLEEIALTTKYGDGGIISELEVAHNLGIFRVDCW